MNQSLSDQSAALLVARDVEKHFGGVTALSAANFELHAGEIHALMGENGAGKSTLGKILAGALRRDRGEMTFSGTSFHPENPQEAQAAGLAMIFQELDLFPELSVAENMAIANQAYRERAWVKRGSMAAFAKPFLEQVGLSIDPGERVGALSIGVQQLVAIARALSMNAQVIVMDESTSALTEDSVETLFTVMRRLKGQGVGIIYVSHKMDEIMEICDRVTVLRDGVSVGTRAVAETNADELIQLMVGRAVDRKRRNHSHVQDSVLLKVEDAVTSYLQGINFELRRGEVLGLAGLVGAGRSELADLLFGRDALITGRLTLNGAPIAPASPRKAMEQGIGLVPEDRKRMGLIKQMSVQENMTIAPLYRMQKAGFVDAGKESAQYEEQREATRLKTASPQIGITSLSGGNQQKVVLARWLLMNPDVLILDDPTRGVDVGAKEEIYGLIEAQAEQGRGVLMVSSELPELLRCCDRILVLNEGHQTGLVDASTADQESIMNLAARPLSELLSA